MTDGVSGATYRDLRGKSVLVSGAGRGIGEATVRAFARNRCVVSGIDVAQDSLDRLVSDGLMAAAFCGDVTDAAFAQSAVEEACSVASRIDVLVNVVGGGCPGRRLREISLEQWDRTVAVNLTSTFIMCSLVLPVMLAQGDGGAIVNIGSMVGDFGMRRNPAYLSSKAAVHALTRALALDYGADEIRVNGVAPGPVLTPLMEENRTRSQMEELGQGTMLGRLGRPDEIAAAVTFLASAESAFMTGETIRVTGGGPVTLPGGNVRSAEK